MNYKIIKSGSDGNSTILENIILIDCGVSFKSLKDYYKNLKIVLLTHIHGDHFNKTTIKLLTKERPTLRFACCKWLVKELIDCGVDKKNIDVLEIGKIYNYRLFKIQPIKLYHDVPNCGYRVFIDRKKAIYCTDTYTLSGISAKNYDLYLIEGNYDDEELENREIVSFLKERIKRTHLSKKECYDFILNNCDDNSKYEIMHQHKER